jgi:hypothetical protein
MSNNTHGLSINLQHHNHAFPSLPARASPITQSSLLCHHHHTNSTTFTSTMKPSPTSAHTHHRAFPVTCNHKLLTQIINSSQYHRNHSAAPSHLTATMPTQSNLIHHHGVQIHSQSTPANRTQNPQAITTTQPSLLPPRRGQPP